MTTLFVVDVETTATVVRCGELLTIGVVAVDEDSAQAFAEAYWRIDRLHALMWDGDTRDWWAQQSEEARAEAYEADDLARLPERTVGMLLREFVADHAPSEPHRRVFVANPVAFDWGWIADLYARLDLENPFSHRSLCLRSMQYGSGTTPWERMSGRGPNEPKIPHHALHDARAEADHLIDMLKVRHSILEARSRELTALGEP